MLRYGWLPVPTPAIRNMANGLMAGGATVTCIRSRARSQGLPTQPLPGADNRIFAVWAQGIPKIPFLGTIRHGLVFCEFVLRCVLAGLKGSPDLVVAVDLDTLLPGWILARIKRTPLVYYQLELYTDRPYVPVKPFWRFLERRLICRTDLVVSCEPNRARLLQERYELKVPPLVVRNVPPYRGEIPRTDRIRAYLEKQEITASKIAFYQGWIAPARCSEVLVEAARLVNPGIVLFLIGPVEEAYKAMLTARIEQHRLHDKVVIHPMVPPEDLAEFTAGADLGLVLLVNDCLNNYYCAPSKLYEYLAHGLPVVAADFPALKDVVEKDEVGLCVAPKTPRLIAEAINTILSDDALHARFSRNARRVAKEKYCYQEEGKVLQKALETLPAERHRRIPKRKDQS